ncbi:hypothetical protein A4A59_017045 [Rhizobium leguminosarum]|uniref:Uncharacterized protein n=1 Tax=Rhizobium leguminosarum TaxID=384 RepID=A0ACD5F0P9_RHILE|nr:hypothetical protein [Rhizobium leguminosarum]
MPNPIADPYDHPQALMDVIRGNRKVPAKQTSTELDVVTGGNDTATSLSRVMEVLEGIFRGLGHAVPHFFKTNGLGEGRVASRRSPKSHRCLRRLVGPSEPDISM